LPAFSLKIRSVGEARWFAPPATILPYFKGSCRHAACVSQKGKAIGATVVILQWLGWAILYLIFGAIAGALLNVVVQSLLPSFGWLVDWVAFWIRQRSR
jgi:hypothetical protein